MRHPNLTHLRYAPVLLVFVLCLGSPFARAQAPFTWTRHLASNLKNSAVAADYDGNVYSLAAFTGTVTVGNRIFKSQGGTDLLLVKYSQLNGAVLWGRQIGGTGQEQAGDLAMHIDEGKLYLTGSFQATARLENASNQLVSPLVSAGQSDVFTAMYQAGNGQLGWARRDGGAGDDNGYGIYLDTRRGVFLTGSFTGTARFKSFYGEYALKSSGNTDIFMAKFNLTGGLQFVNRLGGPGYDLGKAITVDEKTADIYVTGGVSPNSNPYVTDVLVAKYNYYVGAFMWAKTFGSAATADLGNDVTSTIQGVYVTGYFGGSITFAKTTLTSKGSSDAFLTLFAREGENPYPVAVQYGGAGWDEGTSVTPYGADLMLAGTFQGKATFGNQTVSALGGAADRDMFLANASYSGIPEWVQVMGSTGTDGARSVAMGRSGVVVCSGVFGSSITLGKTTLSGSGSLLTAITLPQLNQYTLYNAATDTQLSTLSSTCEINYTAVGSRQINLRFSVVKGSVGSIRFVLDGKDVKIDSGAEPFSYPGDVRKPDGSIDYLPFTPSLGTHVLEITPYSGPNGTGICGAASKLTFTIVDKAELLGWTFFNAATDKELTGKEIFLVNSTYAEVDYAKLGTSQVNIRANTNPAKVGSVKFTLNYAEGSSRITKDKFDNSAPYTLGGEVFKADGAVDYLSANLAPKYYYLTMTAYTGPDGTGFASPSRTHILIIKNGVARLASTGPGPEAEAASAFTISPNPFSQKASLAFTPGSSGPAVVEIYNPQGRLVERLFEGSVEAGTPYAWTFNGSAHPAGVYTGRILLGTKVLHQKMVLSH